MMDHVSTRIVSTRDGVRLNVRVWESGHRPGDAATAPFLLVHGLASNARLWDGVADRLADLGHPVAAVDQRGHGRSDKPDTGYDFETVAADLVAVAEALGFERPVAVGQSWGGNVVVELAHHHPGATRGVACVDGGFIELADRFPDWEACRAALTPPPLDGTPLHVIERSIRAAHPDWSDRAIAGALANFEVRPDGTVAPWLTLDRHLLILRELYAHRPSRVFPVLAVPVLLVPADTGAVAWADDKKQAVAHAEAAARRLRTRWVSPACHDVHAQFPETVAALLHEHVREGFFA
jgi:pimeloyl-ACP methyl ester carboxylesterase